MEEWEAAVEAAHRDGDTKVVLDLFSGQERQYDLKFYLFEQAGDKKILVLNADLSSDSRWDLSMSKTFGLLMTQAERGMIHLVVGGPPCSTWSRARFNTSQPGPRPVRFRG